MGDIRDKVAVVGIGCTKFGELFERSAEDLIVEAGHEVYQHIAGMTALPRIIRKRPDAVVVDLEDFLPGRQALVLSPESLTVQLRQPHEQLERARVAHVLAQQQR